MVDGPDPEFCNLKLAIARAMHASGAADIIADIHGENDDDEAMYFGGPFISDEVLFRRLDDRLVSFNSPSELIEEKNCNSPENALLGQPSRQHSNERK